MGQADGLAPPGFTNTHNSHFKAYLDSEVLVTVLSHNVLLDMGQGGLKDCFRSEDSHSGRLQQISRIWQGLLTTTRSTAVIDRHLTAACNAMCVFLECACSSVLPYVRDFGMSKDTWLQCFEAILESFEEAKVKPMRQVLITLATLLTHHPDQVLSSSIQQEVMTKMARIVLLGEAGNMKAALVVIELFIRRVSSFDDVLLSVEYCLHGKRVEWSRRLASFGVEKAVDDLLVSGSMSGVASNEPEWRATTAFVVALLMALLSRDTQSAAIALYKTYATALIESGRGNHLYSMSTSKQEEKSEAGLDDNFKRSSQSPWILLVQAFLEIYPAAVTPFTDFLFPAIFKQDPNSYREYADTLQKDACNLINLLAVVQVGCHMGLERDPALRLARTIRVIDVHSDQTYDIYGALLSHAEAEVKIRTFGLLLASSSTTTPLPNLILQCLTGHMKYLYGDSDPQSRCEVMSIVRKLVIRLQGGAGSLQKSTINPPNQPEEEEADNPFAVLHQHENFLAWFAKFLEEELRPNVSYQRHIMALKSIDLLVRSGLDRVIATRPSTEISRNQTPWPIHVSLHHPSITCALLNLVIDPFEDVRIASSMLLENLGSAVALPVQKSVGELIRRAEQLASSTGRADHADGCARLYKLYYTLTPDSSLPGVASVLPSKHAVLEEILLPIQKALESVEGDLDVPLQQMSLHARLLSLSYLLQDQNFPGDASEDEALKSLHLEGLIVRMICLCQLVWQRVRARLCLDSPENAEDDVDEEFTAGPKDILSYSWRALRDASLLKCAMLDSPIFRGRGVLSHPSLKCLESIGLLCMDQLSNLRHRGAFSTVSQTFSALCGKIGESNDDSLCSLRDTWYERAVVIIDTQGTRLTRRSAGLPAMMVGLLNGCPQTFFDRFIESFKARARIPNNFPEFMSENGDQQIELPQVHALNCLREVFTNARFRIITEPHVMDILNLAATSLSCDLWAVRNCGLMLFRACTGRLGKARTSLMTGDNTSQPWKSEATISNDRALGIFDLAMNLLDPGCFSQGRYRISLILQSEHESITANDEATGLVATERIFAALDLIGRISPSLHDVDHIERLVLGKLSSKVWQVREQAARVWASRVSPWDAIHQLHHVVDGMFVRKDQNTIHGRLLCAKQIMHSLYLSRSEPLRYDLGRAAAILRPLVAEIMAKDMSSVVRIAFLDIMNDAFEMEILSRISGGDSSHLSFWIGEDIFRNTDLSDGPNFPTHESAAVHEAYQFFSTQSEPEQNKSSIPKLRHLFLNLAKVDFDAAFRFLVRVASQDSWNQNIRNVIDDLYCFIIPNDSFPEDIKSEAMAGLTGSIESNQFDSEVSTGMAEISRCLLYDVKPEGRDLHNAKLRLQANLFTLSSPGGHAEVNAKGRSHLSLWIAMLQVAAWDNIDTPTRLNAASSLLAFTPILLSDQAASESSSQYLQIFLLLYDLLNDDDEDVREIAASAASMILSSEQREVRSQMKLSPLAASENLALFLATKFRRERYLKIAALRRIWFRPLVSVKGGNIEQNVEHCSVKILLEGLQQSSSALFEEEKQNLYIDDVREVEIWSNILKTTEPLEESYLNSTGDWVLAALRDLRDYLDDKVNFDGPLGPTSQADTLTLFVRVIELAGLMLHWACRQPDEVQGPRLTRASVTLLPHTPTEVHDGSAEAPRTFHWRACMSVELKTLGEMGRRLCIHERIMRSIEEIIKKQ